MGGYRSLLPIALASQLLDKTTLCVHKFPQRGSRRERGARVPKKKKNTNSKTRKNLRGFFLTFIRGLVFLSSV
jgi:hypothetical protein